MEKRKNKTRLARAAMTLLVMLCFLGGARAQQALPYEYGFENNDLAADGWTTLNATSTNTGIHSDAKHLGDYGFRFVYSEQNASLISPVLTGGDNGIDVSFWYKESSAKFGDEQFYVGYTTDENVTGPDDFTYGDIITASTSWQQYENIFPAGTKRIAIKYVYNDAFYLFLDDFSFEAVVSCPKPKNLNVTTDGETATVTWKGTADNYNIDINGTVTNNVTSPYTFNVELSTEYTVKVQASCGEGETSDWSNPLSFTTPDCIGGHVIEYTLNDGYGDGWNGASITVVEGCGNLVETLTLNSGSSNSGTLTLCGDYYELIWNTGKYDNECSFTFTENGTTLFTNPSNVSDGLVLYTIGTNTKPTGLAAGTPGTHEVALTWTPGNSETAWQICLNNDESNIININNANSTINEGTVSYTLTGLDANAEYSVMVRAFIDNDTQSCWSDVVTFTTAPTCPKPTNLVAGSIDTHSAVLSWTEKGEADQWQICINGDESNLIAVNENPFTLTNLVPETDYSVKVRAYCSAEDQSSWSDVVTFTTDIANPAPTDVAAGNISATSAEISWTGNADATSYNLRYREYTDPNNDFESSNLCSWTTIDADGDGYTWLLGSAVGGVYLIEGSSLVGSGHNSSTDLVVSASYSNVFGTLTPDNYLVSPKINLGGSINFWACAQDANYPAEHFGVFVSTTGNTDPDDFTMVQEWNMTAAPAFNPAPAKKGTTRAPHRDKGTWYEYTVDLSNYEGQGYVAIRHFNCTDQFLLLVDDIEIEQPNYVVPEWTTVQGASPYTINDLTPSTRYEVQVQAVYADGSSQWVGTSFTTDVEFAAPENLEMTDISTTTATVSWTAPSATVTGYVYQYKKASAEEWSTEATITETSVELSGLDDATSYNFRVKAVYDGGSSTFAKINFMTDCLPKDLPYSYGFEDTNELNCWSLLSANSNNLLGISSFEAPYEGTNVFVFSSYNNASSYDQYLISPTLNTTSPVAVEFYYRIYGNSESVETFVVGYSTTTADPAEFTWGEEISTNTMEWMPYTHVFPAGTKYVAIYYYSNYQFYLLVDDFSITEAESTNILFAKAGYATYYNGEKDVMLPAGMKAHVVTDGSTNLTYAEVADGDTDGGNVVPAGTAVLLQVEPSTEDQTLPVYLVTPSADPYAGTNLLFGSDDATETTGGAKYYKLTYSNDNDKFGWYWGAANGAAFTSPAHKAWLALPASSSAPFLGLPGWEDTTGIVPVGVDSENGEWYTLQGLKIGKKPTTKGVYIHNGRKVVIK